MRYFFTVLVIILSIAFSYATGTLKIMFTGNNTYIVNIDNQQYSPSNNFFIATNLAAGYHKVTITNTSNNITTSSTIYSAQQTEITSTYSYQHGLVTLDIYNLQIPL